MATPIVRIQIPRETLVDPIQAVVDGLTVLHSNGGMPLVETALGTILDVVYSSPRLGGG